MINERGRAVFPYRIVRLAEEPALLDRAARWFHEKWGVPQAVYRESMLASLEEKAEIPAWYLALEEKRIVGGLGVIENDFHDRKDLTPNVCAVYTEAEKRGHGIAGTLLQTVSQT